jgi:uncharacterized membrane protein YheB (UPF0754 family)
MPLSEKTIKEYKRDKLRNFNYKHKYKISLDNFRDKLIHQEFKCDICKLRQMFCGKLQVDHCHKTNKIRSLLCERCNKELGRFEKFGSVNQNRSHLVDPNTEYAKYLHRHHRSSLCP